MFDSSLHRRQPCRSFASLQDSYAIVVPLETNSQRPSPALSDRYGRSSSASSPISIQDETRPDTACLTVNPALISPVGNATTERDASSLTSPSPGQEHLLPNHAQIYGHRRVASEGSSAGTPTKMWRLMAPLHHPRRLPPSQDHGPNWKPASENGHSLYRGRTRGLKL